MQKVGILGSGFGLYGYLPAVFGAFKACEVFLPHKAKRVLEARSELCRFINKVHFSDDFLGRIDCLIIAQNPKNQEKFLREALKRENIKFLFLEKPLARHPKIAQTLQDALFSRENLHARIAYIFPFLSWANFIRKNLKNSREITIKWTFLAHHFSHNLASWKKYSAQGGSALNFYGIHFIALFAKIGFSEVLSCKIAPNAHKAQMCEIIFGRESRESLHESHESPESWRDSRKNLAQIRVIIDSKNCLENFTITNENGIIYRAKTPFLAQDSQLDSTQDSRIKPLKKHLKSIYLNNEKFYAWYAKTTLSWQNALKIAHENPR